MTSRTEQGRPLPSEMAGDIEMRELIEFYLEELSRKVDTIHDCLARDDRQGIRRIAHQLRGSSIGYGYPTIGEAATDLEDALHDASTDADQARVLTDRLLDLCSRALMKA